LYFVYGLALRQEGVFVHVFRAPLQLRV
jgi:hypothetical protein